MCMVRRSVILYFLSSNSSFFCINLSADDQSGLFRDYVVDFFSLSCSYNGMLMNM